MTQNEALKEVIAAYDECKGGLWLGAKPQDITMCENLALCAMENALKGDWKTAQRWARRCIEMEKEIGFENAPLWGEFGDTIERVYKKVE